jgi:hypothetical protein
MKKQLTLVLLFVLSGALFAETLATVGTYTITDKDVKSFMEDMKKSGLPVNTATKEYALNSLIDIKLGVIDARTQTVDQDTKAIEAMDMALYVYYLNKTIDSKYKNKIFSNKEIMAYYQKNPLVKIQRLTYSYSSNVPGSTEKAKIQMNVLRGELKSKKITFESALEKTQDKAIPAITGTFDKLIIDDLAPQEVLELKLLKPMEISGVIQAGKFFAIVRIVKVYPYSPEYADDINERMKKEAIINAREKFASVLRQKYATMIQVNK